MIILILINCRSIHVVLETKLLSTALESKSHIYIKSRFLKYIGNCHMFSILWYFHFLNCFLLKRFILKSEKMELKVENNLHYLPTSVGPSVGNLHNYTRSTILFCPTYFIVMSYMRSPVMRKVLRFPQFPCTASHLVKNAGNHQNVARLLLRPSVRHSYASSSWCGPLSEGPTRNFSNFIH